MKLQAVIFDFDGIIVDTEPIHYAAFQEVLAPHDLSYSWDDYVEGFIGFDDRDALREAYRRGGQALSAPDLQRLVDEKALAFLRLIDKKGVASYAGVIELIRSLSGVVPLGLCSGALRSDIDPILSRLDLVGVFEEIVTADDVDRSKPDPASYIRTLELLRTHHGADTCTPAYSMAIEDTPAGIRSANAAGLRVLAVTNSYAADQLTEATAIVDSLEAVNVNTLDELIDV